MSYSHLPTHLKPCFLHVGVFPEDEKIRVSSLIELWVVEGFLKPICGKNMEVVAQEYFNELIDRNLILVDELGAAGNIRYCRVHDLLRGFCLREAEKERFCCVFTLEQHNLSIPQGSHRRVVIPEWRDEERYEDVLQSTQFARSLYDHSLRFPPLLNFQFLRIWRKGKSGDFQEHFRRYSSKNIFHLVHLRYLNVYGDISTSSFYRFWNLSTIVMVDGELIDASQIWKMPQLRHVRIGEFTLPDPPSGDDGNDIVLGSLQTLWKVVNFKCSEEIIKRIPNIKKLLVDYSRSLPGGRASRDFVNNIEHLCKLESFRVWFSPDDIGFFQKLTFPNSLKKLTIQSFEAEEFLEKIGSLPHLVKLKIIGAFFSECEWITVEGQFRSLRFLLLDTCFQLECWKTESSHFPCLQQLTLQCMYELKEIPSDIGEIPTLESIHVRSCCKSVVNSARKIKEEQEELGNESLQVQVEL